MEWSDDQIADELNRILSMDRVAMLSVWVSASLTIREAARRLKGDGGCGVSSWPDVQPPPTLSEAKVRRIDNAE